MTRKVVVKASFALFLCAVAVALAAAQGYKPTRPIEIVTHTGPGGGGDVAARFIVAVTEKEKLLPVRAVVINKAGGGGAVAAAYMAEKSGDTHTIAFFTSLWVAGPLTSKESRVQFHELTPIARLILDPLVLLVKADSPYKSLGEFIEAAKKAPGQLRQVGGSIESRDNLLRLLLQKTSGASWTYIPFPGGGERVAAMLGGHANFYIADAQEVREYLRSGSLRPVAQMGERRMPALPDVPTVQEAGFKVPTVRSMRGIVGPPAMPREVVEYWENVLERMTKTPMWQQYLTDNQIEDGFQKGATLAQSSEEFIAQRRAIFKEAGIPTYR